MKTSLLLMLFCSVSFLAVCRAEMDEFTMFDETIKGKSQDKAPAKPPEKSAPKPRGDLPESDFDRNIEKPVVKPVAKPVAPTPPTSATAVAPSAPQMPATAGSSAGAPPTAAKPAPNALAKAKIEKLKEEVRKDPKNIHQIKQLADEYYKNAQYEEVTSLLWKSVEKADRASLLLLARAHEKRSEPDQMIKALNVLTSKDPKDYDAFYLLGNAYFIKGKNKETLENYKSSLEINPQFEPAYLGLVKFYEKRKNLYELRILYQDMVDNIGNRAAYLSKLCQINTDDGTFEAAITKCREAIDKNPKDADAHVYLGVSLKGAGDTADAEKSLKTTAIKFPQSEFAQYTYAKVLEDQKNYVDSFLYYKVGASADQQSARCWLGVATSAFELQKFDIAIVAFIKACKLDHKNAVNFRKAAAQIKSSKKSDWGRKYEEASEQCSVGG